MTFGAGMRNFRGTARWSVTYQLPTSTLVELGLNSSIESSCGRSVCVRTSLIRILPIPEGGSSAPGEPPMTVLARQFRGLFGSGFKFGFAGTSEKPVPSADDGHGGRVPYFTEKIAAPAACTSATVWPALERLFV